MGIPYRNELLGGEMGEKPVKILLIEDNPADIKLIQIMLSQIKGRNFSMEFTHSLEEGVTFWPKGPRTA